MTIDAAYEHCRKVAKREAKNFYYAFRVLPKAKSDAMCAVYAFMRQADDISDDEVKTLERRREEMSAWIGAWRQARSVGAGEDMGEDAVFIALSDAQRRFGISDDLLEQLVQGTALDLEPNADAPGGSVTLRDGIQGYKTFEDLYRYCYLVASVVGLVCIRIFGYSDPAAELLAERSGLAFQLTNILRDVKEDAERGRIYLPQDILHEFGVTNEDVLALAGGRAMKPNEHAMITALSVQAWEYYEAAQRLIPMLDADSRAAMWVLVEIYSGLLKKIDLREGDVFSERVSVPTRQKVFALVRGAAMAARGRRS
jgi:phytoene synthase